MISSVSKLSSFLKRWRYALAALVLLGLGVGVKLYFFPANKAPAYVTATAALADIEQSVLATGTVQAF